MARVASGVARLQRYRNILMLLSGHIGCGSHRCCLLHAEEGSITSPLVYNHRLAMLMYISHSLLATLRGGLRVVIAHGHGRSLVCWVMQALVSRDMVLLMHIQSVEAILAATGGRLRLHH